MATAGISSTAAVSRLRRRALESTESIPGEEREEFIMERAVEMVVERTP
jgi:mevalonate kinase